MSFIGRCSTAVVCSSVRDSAYIPEVELGVFLQYVDQWLALTRLSVETLSSVRLRALLRATVAISHDSSVSRCSLRLPPRW